MDRLNDLREEMEKQLRHLKRQANTAERYKRLKQEERRVKAEVLVLRWQDLEREQTERSLRVKQHETRLEGATARLRSLEADIEKHREMLIEVNEAFNEVQGRYYRLGGDISGTEQSIQHIQESRKRQLEEHDQTEQANAQSQAELTGDHKRLAQLNADIEHLEPELENSRLDHEEIVEKLNEIEQEMDAWRQRWEDLSHRLSVPNETAQLERARIEHLERHITQLSQRRVRLDEELSSFCEQDLEKDIALLDSDWEQAVEGTQRHKETLSSLFESIEQRRAVNQSLSGTLDQAKGDLQDMRGRLASLEALQEAALGKRQKQVIQWLEQHRLGMAERLGERLDVEAGWEKALEMVMGEYLEAVCVEGMDAVTGVLGTLEHGQLVLFDTSVATPASGAAHDPLKETLLSKVSAPWSLHGLLDGIYVAADLEQALSMRDTLVSNESVITIDGLWIGHNWLRVARDPDEHAGVLARENEIKALSDKFSIAQQRVEELQLQLAEGQETLVRLELTRDDEQTQCNLAHRGQNDIESRLKQRRHQLEQMKARRKRLSEELTELQGHYDDDKVALEKATQLRNEALAQIDLLSSEREDLNAEKEILGCTLTETRSLSRQRREHTHGLALRLESMRSSRDSTGQAIERLQGQLVRLQGQLESLTQSLEQSTEPLRENQQALEALLAQRVEVERELNEARARVHSVEAAMREQDQQRLEIEREIEVLRSEQDKRRMAWQEVSVRCRTLKERLDESGFELQVLIDELDEGATLSASEEQAGDLARKIERLGSINLAAIDEYQEQSKRKEHLDSQFADLNEALETLENAIRRIDKETRQRFRDTFERVNNRLQEMFPRLFGGGQAHLVMTGEDLLTTGVSIMARPPGKRLSTIHLMSGGEKALTAVAMVFAIFALNPAPFCLLDEVDAPLDEANVDRFCEVVREMSANVQFIFITHNKTTMEYAKQLVGVTMHEPGVSRLVTVDVDEAVQMATA
jgi:chromosome segregation protein